MKDIIGKKVRIVVSGVSSLVEGVLVDDANNLLVVQLPNGVRLNVVKAYVAAFSVVDDNKTEQDDAVMSAQNTKSPKINLGVIKCQNDKIGCKGVYYFRKGISSSFQCTRNIFNEYAKACPCLRNSCQYRYEGDMSEIDGRVLSDILDKTIVGDFPSDNNKNQDERI